jgi:hypothetical protein
VEAFANAGVIGILFDAGQPRETNGTNERILDGQWCGMWAQSASWASNQITFTMYYSNGGSTANPWNLNAGDQIYVYGASPTGYNGWWTVVSASTTSTSPYTTTITVTAPTNPGAWTSGGYVIPAPKPVNGNVLMPIVSNLSQGLGMECDGGFFRQLSGLYYSLGAMPIQ